MGGETRTYVFARQKAASRPRLPWAPAIALAAAAVVPPIAFWPPAGFDAFYFVKARVILLLGLLMGLWWAARLVRGKAGLKRMTAPLALGIVLSCWLVASSLLSGDPSTAVWGSPGRDDGLLVWLSGLVILATAAALKKESAWRFISLACAGAAVLVAACSVAQHFGLDVTNLPEAKTYARSSGTFRNPVFLGGYLALVIPMVVVLPVLTRSLWARVLATLGLGMVVSAIHFSFSRAAWVGASVSLAVYVVWVFSHQPREVRLTVITIAVAGLVAVGIAHIPRQPVPGSETHSLAADAATVADLSSSRNAGRLAIWEISLQMIEDHPWFGVGLDQMGDEFERYRTARFEQAEGPNASADRAHSDPIHVAVTAGIPASLLLFAFVIVIYRRFARIGARAWTPCSVAMAAGSLGYLVASLVSITVPGVHSLFSLFLGGLLAAADSHTARSQ